MCSCVVQIPYSPQTSCSLVTDMDGVIEPSNTHILPSLLPWFHIMSIYLSASLVVVLPLVSVFVFCVVRLLSFVCFACLLVQLFACAMSVRACLRALA